MKRVFVLEESNDWINKEIGKFYISEEYTHIRIYHACKPINVGSYFEKGIMPLDINSIKSFAESIFCKRFSEITSCIIDKAIDYVGRDTREGYIYFALDMRGLIRYCGHYLIYGSEFLQAMTVYFRKVFGNDYSYVLKEIGIPTIFYCDIPIDFIKESTIKELNERITKSILEYKTHKGIDEIDFSFWLTEPVKPDLIAGHYHPNRIEDPIQNFEVYKTKLNRCDWCGR